MGSQGDVRPLSVVFLPFPTPGHMIPMVDLAKIFSTFNGVTSTIITTPANAALFQTSVAGKRVVTRELDFPAAAVGLPAGVENYGFVTSPEMRPKLYQAIFMLQNPTKDLIRQISPDCIISDKFYSWSSDFAAEIGVPRFVFGSTSVFSACCAHSVKTYAPHRRVESDDTDVFCIPSLPRQISMLRSQLPAWEIGQHPLTTTFQKIQEAELKSRGIVVNTLEEMEGEYVDHYSSVSGLKIWPIGPVSLWAGLGDNETIKAQRGHNHGPTSPSECLEWLAQKPPQSVLFVSFGSLTRFPAQQLKEIAAGLEDSGHNFIWVARRDEGDGNNDDEWLPEGFRGRMKEKNQGLIIEKWAPQLSILGHTSTGGMVTHCGWNSILEGVNAGLPFVTWPLFAEQFYNERLLVDVIGVGVAVGVTTWCNIDEVGLKELVGRDKVTEAVKAVMGGGERQAGLRRRAAELREAAKKAVEDESGSSRANLAALVEEIRAKKM